jgi:hypothetical protein
MGHLLELRQQAHAHEGRNYRKLYGQFHIPGHGLSGM